MGNQQIENRKEFDRALSAWEQGEPEDVTLVARNYAQILEAERTAIEADNKMLQESLTFECGRTATFEKIMSQEQNICVDQTHALELADEEIKALKSALSKQPHCETVDIVFDGPLGPEGPRFVEVENASGKSIRLGKWVKRPDGYWVLRFPVVLEKPEPGKEDNGQQESD